MQGGRKMQDESKLLKLLADTLHDVYKHLSAMEAAKHRNNNIMEQLKNVRAEIKSLKEVK